jgi:tetratricopeptide (TPR) repeat protein/TolB-like protein
MASLIPGYEYDIFISYRQKDNKGDRWVSEFVEALKTELESTFKEEISVYFDINPHDGLLETHDVNASLQEKLKCLVFIPIISRTYCDPKSFAWKNEFKAFVEQASRDQFGLKVKLPNGNVANRVLPVRIHVLDIDDIKLCESILGGVLRGVEFIYRSAGVNRPLRSEEEKPHENLNQTIYRDQINKVANAVKEIVSGLRAGEVVSGKEKTEPVMPWEEAIKEKRLIRQLRPNNINRHKLRTRILLISILVILAGLFVYPRIFKADSLKKLRASDGRIPIAVMPFQNISNDSTLNYLKDWIPESVISYLSNFSEDFQVRQTETIYGVIKSQGLTSNASITPSIAVVISQKLDASIFISGSLTKTSTGIIINANLINSQTEEVLKSFQEKGISEEITQKIDTLSQKIKDYLTVSLLKKKLNPEVQRWISTSSPEALKHYILGRYERRDFLNNPDFSKDLAHEEFLKAIRIDSNFTAAYFSLIGSYEDKELYDSAKFYCLGLYGRRDQMTPQFKLRAEIIHSTLFKLPSDCIKYLKQLLEIDDQQPGVYSELGFWYRVANQPDKAIPVFEKSLEIYNKWGIKPPLVSIYTLLGESYCDTKQYKKAERLYKKAEQDFPDNQEIIWYEFQVSVEVKDTVAANDNLKKFVTFSRENSRSEFYIAISIANVYEAWDYHEKAEEYIQKALKLPPDNPEDINVLAWTLIDMNRNINEGLELADKALELDPHNYAIWDTKGWGLYKLGKYNEALDALQKADSVAPKHDPEVFSHIQEVKKAIANQK